MAVEIAEDRRTEIALRQEAHYRRAQHARATEREAAWKQRAEQLEQVVRDQAAQIAELTRENETLKARVVWLEQQVFGRKSEQTQDATPSACDDEAKADSPPSGLEGRRRRGKQPGSKGYGRKRRPHLPTEEVVHDPPVRYCGRDFRYLKRGVRRRFCGVLARACARGRRSGALLGQPGWNGGER
ncbi:MAG TPA: hypothetical protein VLM89_02365 [Phycisphaerae bacterium]|nr:hypothetical protein [Phycisphaerae bacterium]